jgi:hypothetical protein
MSKETVSNPHDTLHYAKSLSRDDRESWLRAVERDMVESPIHIDCKSCRDIVGALIGLVREAENPTPTPTSSEIVAAFLQEVRAQFDRPQEIARKGYIVVGKLTAEDWVKRIDRLYENVPTILGVDARMSSGTVSPRPTMDDAMAAAAAVQAADRRDRATCDAPPPGWSCTRARGHEGPCAATADLSFLWPCALSSDAAFVEALRAHRSAMDSITGDGPVPSEMVLSARETAKLVAVVRFLLTVVDEPSWLRNGSQTAGEKK